MPILLSRDDIASGAPQQYGDLLIAPRVSLLGSLTTEAEERLATLVEDEDGTARRSRRKKVTNMIVNDTVVCEGPQCEPEPPSTLVLDMFEDVEDLDDL